MDGLSLFSLWLGWRKMNAKQPKPAIDVRGIEVDRETRCAHYRSPLDIVALKMKCCGVYYACKGCHLALANHTIQIWLREERDERAVLCGACGREMTIREYLECDSRCPHCGAAFNPSCRNHYHFYFQM
jgi:uncharacterized CHY-type Zn-finger protein